jgi:hypothetical protein
MLSGLVSIFTVGYIIYGTTLLPSVVVLAPADAVRLLHGLLSVLLQAEAFFYSNSMDYEKQLI